MNPADLTAFPLGPHDRKITDPPPSPVPAGTEREAWDEGFTAGMKYQAKMNRWHGTNGRGDRPVRPPNPHPPAAAVSSSPATPEGGREASAEDEALALAFDRYHELRGGPAAGTSLANVTRTAGWAPTVPSPASPSREWRLFNEPSTIGPWDIEDPAPPPASPAETREGLLRQIEADRVAYLDLLRDRDRLAAIVRAASPAVSLPGERVAGPGTCSHGYRMTADLVCPTCAAPSLPGEQPGGEEPRRRLRACVEAWPQCEEGAYDPACCRFPKSCSCTVYDPDRVTEADLEPAPALPGERADGEDQT